MQKPKYARKSYQIFLAVVTGNNERSQIKGENQLISAHFRNIRKLVYLEN